MLYIVSTPIGNLKDISERAIKTLKEVDVILAEDIPDAKKLLSAYDIHKEKIFKFNDKNKDKVADKVRKIILEDDVAYITSAGTPSISDPGSDLINIAMEEGVVLNVIPGPSALTSAVAMSGIKAQQFYFVSFPPKKKGKLEKLFEENKNSGSVLVFFESPHRIISTLELLDEVAPDALVFIAKEMTKLYERYFKNTPSEVIKELENSDSVKGEFVVVVDFSKSKPKRKKLNKYEKIK